MTSDLELSDVQCLAFTQRPWASLLLSHTHTHAPPSSSMSTIPSTRTHTHTHQYTHTHTHSVPLFTTQCALYVSSSFLSSCSFSATVCKTDRPMLWDRCLSVCLSVTLVYYGQTVGWIKMPLGTELGLGPDHTVLDGDPAPPPERSTHPYFSAHVYCGQTAAHLSNC